MPLSPQEEQELAQLKAQAEKLTANPTYKDMEAYEKGGVTHPVIDPIDFIPVGGAAKLGMKAGGAVADTVASKPANAIADFLMRKAVGAKNAPAGIGNELVNQGILGTKGMMESQIAKKLPQAEAAVQEAVKGIKAPVSSQEVGKGLEDLLKGRMTPKGSPVSGAQDDIRTIYQRIGDVAGRGDVAPSEALALARGAEKNAYKTLPGEVRPGVLAELGAKEGQLYKGALKGQSEDVARGLRTEQALILGRNALRAPSDPSQAMVNAATAAAKGLGGYAAGGVPGALATQVATSPAGMSAGAHLLQRAVAPAASVAGQAAGGVAGAGSAKALEEYLANKGPNKPGLTDAEERELQELKSSLSKLQTQ